MMESIIALKRTCQNCGKQITSGRRGKKFCSDYCRVDFSNQKLAKTYRSPFVRNITNALIKNRGILETALSTEKTVKANRDNLTKQGFNFTYVTNTVTIGDRTYFYCYDYGYLPLKNDWFLVVKFNK